MGGGESVLFFRILRIGFEIVLVILSVLGCFVYRFNVLFLFFFINRFKGVVVVVLWVLWVFDLFVY